MVEGENWMVMLCCWIDYLAKSIWEHTRASWSYWGWGVCIVEEFVKFKAMVVRFFIDFLMQSWFSSHVSVVLIDNKYGESIGEQSKCQLIWSSSVLEHLSESRLQSVTLFNQIYHLTQWSLVWNFQIYSYLNYFDFICSVLLSIH